MRLTEYNFKIPTAVQEVDQAGDASHPSGDIESYDWPGDYLTQDEGTGVVTSRLEQARRQAPRHEADGDVVSLGAGWRVTLGGDEVTGATGHGFVCLKATHRFRAQAYGSGDAGGDETPYAGTYVLMPDNTPYRPEQRIVGPRVQGPETAVVVGEGEIDCDEYGRILCRFHWDIEGAHTMRVRVSQNWASKGWGGMVIPRIGMEVIVEHLRGDPDKPTVTGCVYNGKNTPPYELPEHKTRSTFKTDTHQGEGFDELRFEDENGREEVFVHAQKDRNKKTENNHSERIDNNWVQSVGRMKASETGGNRRDAVVGGWHTHIGPQAINMVANPLEKWDSQGISDAAVRSSAGPGDVGGYPGNFRVDVENHLVETIGSNFTRGVGQHAMMSVAKKYTIGVGDVLNINAGSEVNITCGACSIRMTRSGKILINGVEIDIVSDKRVSVLSDVVKIN